MGHTSKHPKKAAFLAAYMTTATVAGAARAAGINRETHYAWLKDDADYAAAFADAREAAIEHLEDVARRRAVEGSDTLLIFLLKAARPSVYRERWDGVNVAVGGRTVVINIGTGDERETLTLREDDWREWLTDTKAPLALGSGDVGEGGDGSES